MRRGVVLVVILAALGGCQSLKEQTIVAQMQMPPKPAGTARIVLFRHDALTGAPSAAPEIIVNGRPLGRMSDEGLYIRDVPPGDQVVSLAMAKGEEHDTIVIGPAELRASLNAGGEWYVETTFKQPCETGMKAVNTRGVYTGTAIGDAAVATFGLASIALAYASAHCSDLYALQPAWPQATWDINPLLAKAGAKPAVPEPDHILPQSGLSWHAVTEAIRTNIFSHDDDYKALLLAKKDSSLLVQDIGFVSEVAGATGDKPGVVVTFDYLEVEADILAGQHARRRLHYTLTRDGDTLAVSDWRVIAP